MMTKRQEVSSKAQVDLPVGEVVEDLLPSSALRREPLHGKSVSLIPLDAGRDAASLFEISHGSPELESVWTYLGYGPFDSVEAMREHLRSQQQSEDPLFFTVIDRESGTPLGVVSFLAFDRESRCVEVGHIWYGVSHQRGRTNTETIYVMLKESFDVLRCRRVEWKCDALNQRSWNAARRLGFRDEGVFRQHRIVKGRNRDTAWLSVVDHEWPEVSEAMETWIHWQGGNPPSLASLRGRGG